MYLTKEKFFFIITIWTCLIFCLHWNDRSTHSRWRRVDPCWHGHDGIDGDCANWWGWDSVGLNKHRSSVGANHHRPVRIGVLWRKKGCKFGMQVQLKMTNYFYIILWTICESWTIYIKLFTIELNTMTSGYLSFKVRKWSEEKGEKRRWKCIKICRDFWKLC